MTDSARVRGENVGPWEVEAVAARHPDIADCAMIGVAAGFGEQDIKLFVELRPGRQPDPRGALAGAALFLVSPGSEFVTGQALAVDGGLSIQA
jgi:acyl-coenzyme A synthetase/AMP-(fatty) acid ligase